jgi:hypothetical protein
MRFCLGELHCVFCHFQDVCCTEWFPDLAKEPVEDWILEDPVPAYAQSNFSNTGDITLLVNCRTCQEWFQFDARSHKITIKNLPMSLKYDDVIVATHKTIDLVVQTQVYKLKREMQPPSRS